MEWNELLKIIMDVVQTTIVPAVIAYLGYQTQKVIQNNVSKDKQKEIDKIIRASVVWVEQITGKNIKYESEEKFNFAKERALKILNDKGLQVTDEYLDMLIENFVHEITWEQNMNEPYIKIET